MNPDVFAAIVEGTATALAGAYCTALAHGVVGKKPGMDLRWDQWREKSGSRLKILGPLIIAFGFFLAIKGVNDAPHFAAARAAAEQRR